MKLILYFVLFANFAQAQTIKVKDSVLSEGCQAFLKDLKSCKPGECRNEKLENDRKIVYKLTTLGKDKVHCKIQATRTEVETSNAMTFECRLNNLQMSRYQDYLKQLFDKKEFEFTKSKCSKSNSKCRYTFDGGKVAVTNVLGLAALHQQCKSVKPDQ